MFTNKNIKFKLLPDKVDKPPLSLFTLSFDDKNLNREFYNGLALRSLKVVRFSMLFAILIFFVFGLLVAEMIPNPAEDYLYNRIFGMSLCMSIFILTYYRLFKRYSQEILSLFIILGGLNVLLISLDNSGTLYVGLILTSIYAHSLLRLRFMYASITTWILVLSYLLIIGRIQIAESNILINNAFFLISGNILGMVASYSIEYYMRSAYWKSLILCAKSAELETEYKRKSLELESARQIQISLLPQKQNIPNIDLSVVMKPASEIGGDYYDYHLSENNDTLTFAVGDATGHGARAGAMVTAMKILFSHYAPDSELIDFLTKANNTIRQLRLPRLYMAFAIGRIKDNKLEIAGVGLPPLLIYNSTTGKTDKLDLKGLPLGSIDEYDFEKKEYNLNQGDSLVLMTDGITELFNENRQMIGYDQIENAFTESAENSTDLILNNILLKAESWSSDASQHDDITVLVMKIKDDLNTESSSKNSETVFSGNKKIIVSSIKKNNILDYSCIAKKEVNPETIKDHYSDYTFN